MKLYNDDKSKSNRKNNKMTREEKFTKQATLLQMQNNRFTNKQLKAQDKLRRLGSDVADSKNDARQMKTFAPKNVSGLIKALSNTKEVRTIKSKPY